MGGPTVYPADMPTKLATAAMTTTQPGSGITIRRAEDFLPLGVPPCPFPLVPPPPALVGEAKGRPVIPCEASATPAAFVLAGMRVPVGAATDIAGRLLPVDAAASIAAERYSAAFSGTVDRRPMRGGSCEGWVKFP